MDDYYSPHICLMAKHEKVKSKSKAKSNKDITPSDAPTDPPTIMQGPMTQARRRQLNLEVSSFLSDHFHIFENRLLPNDVILTEICIQT